APSWCVLAAELSHRVRDLWLCVPDSRRVCPFQYWVYAPHIGSAPVELQRRRASLDKRPTRGSSFSDDEPSLEPRTAPSEAIVSTPSEARRRVLRTNHVGPRRANDRPRGTSRNFDAPGALPTV